MKKLILLFFILLESVFANSFQTAAIENQPATQTVRDSLKVEMVGKDFLYYSTGHHGVVWSLVYREAGSYRMRIGTTRGNNQVMNAEFDTVAFLNANGKLLAWGLDTLPVIAKKMTPQHRTVYWPIYESLYGLNAKTGDEFFSDNAIGYSGPDSVAFNEKFTKLNMLMYWLAAPDVRQVLPESMIF